MQFTTSRDAAVITGAAAIVIGVAYAVFDDIVDPLLRRPAAKPEQVPVGANYDLYRVVPGNNDGKSRSTYVRPANLQEQEASHAAYEIDGVGVFGVDNDGKHVLPGTQEWAKALGAYSGYLNYYRVG
jgi:hypothetical protein